MAEHAIDALFVSFQEALVGRYSLERELGRGGMGVVYLAREVRLDRPVAIKLLPPEFAAQPTLRERFLREARTAARLSHPYIVPIHAVDDVGDFVFYAMAYVDGESLAERVRDHGPLKPADASCVLREVAWALAYAHAQGVVHRDVKPANIMLERGTERAVIMDFGIARMAGGGETAVGEVLGTPEYMSPEQACGEPVDGRSDLYSLGIVGYFTVSGTLPFTGGPREVLAQQITKNAASVATIARGTPRTLAAAIDRCLLKDAAERFQTGEALAEALAPALEKRGEMPVPLRVFLDRRRMIQLVAFPAAGIATLGSLMLTLQRGGVPTSVRTLMVAGFAVLFVVGPVAVLGRRLRQVMRHGFGPDDIAAAIHTLREQRREEFLYEHGATLSKRERLLRAGAIAGLATAAVSLAALVFHQGADPGLIGVALVGSYLGGLCLLVWNKWRRLRHGSVSLWEKVWSGRGGRALARIAGVKLGQRAIPADRPTELGIAMSAEALYAGLPKPLRKSLGDVPAVLHELETHARAMRARMTELDGSIADVRPASARADTEALQQRLDADLRASRAAAEQRLGAVVTALETLRLDLLRLQAGAGSADSITQNLSSARALSEDVDRLLEGQMEVQRALKPLAS